MYYKQVLDGLILVFFIFFIIFSSNENIIREVFIIKYLLIKYGKYKTILWYKISFYLQ